MTDTTMMRPNTDGDPSPEAKAARRYAVAIVGCPKCGALAGDACKAKGGFVYQPTLMVHAARLDLAAGVAR